MNTQQNKTGRRKFLREAVQTLVAAPFAVASIPASAVDDATELVEGPDPFPGDPGYRDPDTYGSLAD